MLLFGLGSAKTIVFVAIVFKRLWETPNKVKHVEHLFSALFEAPSVYMWSGLDLTVVLTKRMIKSWSSFKNRVTAKNPVRLRILGLSIPVGGTFSR